MSDAGTPAPPNPPSEDLSLKNALRNYLSLFGLALAAVSLVNIVFLFLVDMVSKQASPYIGIFAYMVMPAFLVLGLVLVPIGMWSEREAPPPRAGVSTAFSRARSEQRHPARAPSPSFSPPSCCL